MLEDRKIALLGAGVMAEMMAQGLVKSKLVEPENIMVSHYRQDRLDEFAARVPVRTTTNNTDAYLFSDVCILCVRPQAMTTVLRELRPVVDGSRLLSTIAAGLPISLYESELNDQIPFVRSMPTFFGQIKAGTTGLALNAVATAQDLAIASRIYGTFSENVIVLPEDEIDAFTTFGSTTTATVYVLLDALITAGSLIGMRHQASHSRAIEQLVAAARNVEVTDKRPSQLLDELCTPGGVTVEGLKVLEERASRAAIIDAILAATNRAKELREASERTRN